MKLISNKLCRRRYRVQIKARRLAKRNKMNIFFFCIVIAAIISCLVYCK